MLLHVPVVAFVELGVALAVVGFALAVLLGVVAALDLVPQVIPHLAVLL